MKFGKKRFYPRKPIPLQDPLVDELLHNDRQCWPLRRKVLLLTTILFFCMIGWIEVLSSFDFDWNNVPFVKRIIETYDPDFTGKNDPWRQCSSVFRVLFFISSLTNVMFRKPSVIIKDMGMLFSGIYMFTVSQEFACVSVGTAESTIIGLFNVAFSITCALALVHCCSFPRHTTWKAVPIVVSLYALWALIIFTPAIIIVNE